ncbi:MAG: GTPase Era [Verrucomicrobia subdivision 3 bacterium]|nr:GTPase Era [Limisphaerales bacterium]MCS1413550.1 GTPase Era [Limisphaerales bacterium]
MTTSNPLPIYAVVGHPNEGKSSVVATLTEDDSVRISPTPGETTVNREYSVRIDDRAIIQFIDTPGFQHPRQILEWFRAREATTTGLAAKFLEAHHNEPGLAHDRELLTPLAQECGVIYVIDGSRPISSTDRMEMEILRLTGNPRMAVINPKDTGEAYIAQWKSACSKSFNSIRLFNAHQATYSERIALLESLKSMNQDWEAALATAISAFEEDWANRIRQVSGIFCHIVRQAITHTESKSVFKPDEEAVTRDALQKKYRKALHEMERNAHQQIRHLFKHSIFNLDIPPQSILHDDLFTSRTWQVLGLSKKQIISTAVLLGGGLGVKLDLMAAGLSFGIFTLSGALAGATAAWLKGEDLARTRIKKQKLGGTRITVGPNTNPQFPFILLDRALLYFQHVSNWAHARPVPVVEGSSPIKLEDTEQGFTKHWSKEQRTACAQFIKAIATDQSYKKQENAERAFRTQLQQTLH